MATISNTSELELPICNDPLEVYTSGNSYQISCRKDGRITVFRGFSNALLAWVLL